MKLFKDLRYKIKHREDIRKSKKMVAEKPITSFRPMMGEKLSQNDYFIAGYAKRTNVPLMVLRVSVDGEAAVFYNGAMKDSKHHTAMLEYMHGLVELKGAEPTEGLSIVNVDLDTHYTIRNKLAVRGYSVDEYLALLLEAGLIDDTTYRRFTAPAFANNHDTTLN